MKCKIEEDTQMTQVEIKYNPYKMETKISVSGHELEDDNILYGKIKGKRLQEWISDFPKKLVDNQNSKQFEIEFYGTALDWDDFEDAFKTAKEKGIISELNLKYIEAKDDEEINEKIVKIFEDLQEGPVDDFKDPKLKKAFENINNAEFPINVVATMSSGKSTLINALLNKKLMPAKNEACTATITEILDNDSECFKAVVLGEDNVILEEIPELTYEKMNELNDNEEVQRIKIEGDIPFLDANNTALKLVDTPGPNNARNQEHKNTTYRAINNDSNNLILYVLNGTQLGTNDEDALLSYIAEQMKKGGKQVRDRFLFVINKMDNFNPDEEDIEGVIKKTKNNLERYGILDPQIFPCSASTALNLKLYFEDVDTKTWNPLEYMMKLPSEASNTIPNIFKFVNNEKMHLEKYTTLSPSEQRQLEYDLSVAEKEGDTIKQALIHCGIYSIQAAITVYVKKYAKTKKIKDLVESFQEVLASTEVLAKAKTQVAEDEKAAQECQKRAAKVKQKIEDGKEAEIFEAKIDHLNPMGSINYKAKQLRDGVDRKVTRVFEPYGDTITNKEEAKRLVKQFLNMGSDEMAELTVELESVINQEIKETGEKILTEYLEKLRKFDEDTDEKSLDFGTEDLIKGALNNMKASVEEWHKDDFVNGEVEDLGNTTYEEKVYYEKVGEKEEEVADGTEKVKVGTEKVKVGSHKEKVGTRSVRNPEKRWWKIWTLFEPKYIDEDVYEEVDDYEDQDVYETVIKWKTVKKDIFEERREQIEHFSVEVNVIQVGLLSKFRRNLDEGIEQAKKYAKEQVEEMKAQFEQMFDELDELIKEKYTELEQCAKESETKEIELEKNKKLCNWIEQKTEEIEEILEI